MSYQRVIIVFHFMILSIRITEKSKQTRRQQRSEIERQQSWKPMNDRNAEKTKPAACFLQADLT